MSLSLTDIIFKSEYEKTLETSIDTQLSSISAGMTALSASFTYGDITSESISKVSASGTTSATLEDVAGTTITITNTHESKLLITGAFELATQDGAASSTIEIAISIDGTDYAHKRRYLSGTNDTGIGAISYLTAAALATATHTIKLRYRRVSGTATPGINNADILAQFQHVTVST